MRIKFALLMTACLLVLALPAQADFITINQPDAAYLASTTKLGIPCSGYCGINSLSDATLTVTFGSQMQGTQVGSGWATWGAPPNTESATPAILYSGGATSITMNFSTPVNIFGFEAEPNPFEQHMMTAVFYDGLDEIARLVNGSSGARLFAASTTTGSFSKVVFSSDVDFAIGQLRYGVAPVPEPASLLLLGTGLSGLAAKLRKRR